MPKRARKTATANRSHRHKPVVVIAAPTRSNLIVREHVDLSTTEVQFRLNLASADIAGLTAEEAELQLRLASCRRTLRIKREDAAALQSILEGRRTAGNV